MNKQTLYKMFRHLRRAFTTTESRELLTEFFPQQTQQIKELKMSEVQNGTNGTGKKVTNMARAREIYAKAEDKSRKAIIQLFMDQLGQPQATASTYYYSVAPKVERVSNVSKAREIYATAGDKSRKALVPIFVAQLGQNENVASTYYYNCKKYFAELAAAEVAAESLPNT